MADADVKTLVATYGYDEARLSAGKSLLARANQLQHAQQKEYGDQFQATGTLNGLWTQADAEYVRHLKIARIALKDDHAAWQKLALSGGRKNSLSGWLAQARQFYLNALEDSAIIAKLAQFGLTQEKLEAGKTLLEQTEAANAAQKKEMGEAQQATQERDAALDALEDWLSDYVAIARIALEERPQLLEKLGIIERS